MMKEIITILSLLVLTIGCKSYEFKAQNKSELAKVCLAEFPPNYEPIDIRADTITIVKKEWIEVDCDTIGKKEVPHVCEVKTVVKTITVPDSRQTYLILNLEGKLELKRERISQLISLHSEAIGSKDKQHKEEIESLKTKYNNETDSLRKDRNKWRWIVILIGAILGIGVIRKLKII